ncbi:relaxase domain-containing protein [Intrasporangium calvum]|uniref:Relaxase domain-containing protein n=1 Tax=Intrasporangium calvum TaxID=53358 RepID=A0ABT5GDV5_9MICO|nr:MobF family relaxase [Intrasporangium calvum]MDC5696309.1 relaxase domain-containing protein [Intrasporangium calvum]
MSIHKLTAGSGYDYLTRQVAALDATERGHTGLASYYTAKGEAPGVWVGSGLDGIEGLAAGDVVTAEQMQALFGSGHHPLAHERRARLAGDASDEQVQAVTRLGQPYKVYAGDVSAFRLEVAKRIAALNTEAGLPQDSPVALEERARVRTEVATELFRAEHGRDPEDAREVAATIAKHSRPRTNAVAGYDLTFSPVKAVSSLWAIASPEVAARIERAHQAAVKDALTFIEEQALFTRTGTNGVRQVDVLGLVATAFTHRDSRAGDPDLHTHVAVANKVQTLDGRWLSIDGRVLFKATVAASETYNTALEQHLRADLGVTFAERPQEDARKRPVREVVGVDPRLNERWSSRRRSIEARRSELAADFQAAHGRPPTPVESIQLAQQATLETREAKHEPRSLTEQRQAWRAQAIEVLGGADALDTMAHDALSREPERAVRVDDAWVEAAAQQVVKAVESRRATWQVWHVRAEAQRRVRAAGLAAGESEQAVDRVVEQALTGGSVSLARPDDGLVEPPALRRRDGASVYTVAGADQYTSARVLAAEQRLVATAGLADGYAAGAASVDLALLEATANGTTLNAGQAALVRSMATSGARLQLAIAPAGAGKTTAMRALAGAWTDAGGEVIGLAPSAAAAAALREHTGTNTDTLAKLVWSIEHDDLPDWAATIGPQTLVVIDEAGMADTLSLDAAVAFVVARGGSVRLIGDDQQLAAIGAGGVLRDIEASHGAARLTELMRFADPAEGAASLALRDGRPEALGFYLDHGRVHVGDLATMTEDVFTAWQNDRAEGRDAIMLAPTRELVAELNQRARAHRLTQEAIPAARHRRVPAPAGRGPGSESSGIRGTSHDNRAARLADGNEASVGDLIITRANERRLRISATDWVKNGDRWTVRAVGADGGLSVQHTRTGRLVTLPARYVTASTELGYATTVHGAQGVSVDVMHGLATGAESRQQLYTMLTRGRHANHVYLQVVGDGDPHTVIRPETISPPTPTDLLETVLIRDDSPTSASTLLREAADPAVLLGQATSRYVDALYAAAEDLLGPEAIASVASTAEALVPGVREEAAWPTLRAHLLLLGASGTDPAAALRAAIEGRELDTAGDRAAVLDWRLDDSGLRNAGPLTGVAPLPWVPAVPARLAADPVWGQYLTRRADLVGDLAAQVRAAASQAETPAWATGLGRRVDAALTAEVDVWRAAMQVPESDRRPTGPRQLAKAPALWQRDLDAHLAAGHAPAMDEWAPLLRRVAPRLAGDEFAPILAERLAALSRAGVDARALLERVAAQGPLPDDHAAAALWWRISHHVEPAVATAADPSGGLSAPWTHRLTAHVGADRAAAIQTSAWWPALVTAVDHALARGNRIDDLLDTAGRHLDGVDVDECHAMVWRISVLTEPASHEPHDGEDLEVAPEDLLVDVEPPADAPTAAEWEAYLTGHGEGLEPLTEDGSPAQAVEAELQLAALVRDTMGPLDPSEPEIQHLLERAHEWDHCPVTRERMVEVNELSLAFFEARFERSWVRDYLAARFHEDLAGHLALGADYRPGYAPAGWTGLVEHLRSLGVTDKEMTLTGVATIVRTGRLIDRFRDRAVLPIIDGGQVLGFVGRRHPHLTDADNAGPKYLNTADTPLFHKGAQLFGVLPWLRDAGAVPVLVEGPMDAIAVTLATGGSHIGVAPLGTALTEAQARQLVGLATSAGTGPVVATDGDLAGWMAAERAYWLLAQHGAEPLSVRLDDGTDPAQLLAAEGPAGLSALLRMPRPLGHVLVHERLANLPGQQAVEAAAAIVAAQPSSVWEPAVGDIAAATGAHPREVRRALLAASRAWNADPRPVAQQQLAGLHEVRTRMGQGPGEPAQRHTQRRTPRESPAEEALRPRPVPNRADAQAPAAPRR